MRALILLVILNSVTFGQDGIPKDVGTGLIPAGLEETDLKAISQHRIESLKLAVESLQSRYQAGLVPVGLLLDAQTDLALAQLESTTVKQERLDHIENALKSSLLLWQRVKQQQAIGGRGGEVDVEAQTRAAVFKYREMWLKEKSGNSH